MANLLFPKYLASLLANFCLSTMSSHGGKRKSLGYKDTDPIHAGVALLIRPPLYRIIPFVII